MARRGARRGGGGDDGVTETVETFTLQFARRGTEPRSVFFRERPVGESGDAPERIYRVMSIVRAF